MYIDYIRKLLLQWIESLITEFFIDNTLLIKVCSSKQLITVFQTSTIKGICHYNTNNILRRYLCDLIIGWHLPIRKISRLLAELLNIFSALIPVEWQQCQNKVVLLQRYAARVNTNENLRDILFFRIGLNIEYRKCVLFQIHNRVNILRDRILLIIGESTTLGLSAFL